MRFDFKALGRLKVRERNKTEAAYEQHLELLKRAGEILWYNFHGLKFRLADKLSYTPDFIVMNKNHQIEVHEVKGFWMDDARAKIKMAAEIFPFTFIAIKKNGRNWDIEEF